MILFFPYGVREGEVCDPEVVAKELQTALEVAQKTCHYQWSSGAITTSTLNVREILQVSTKTPMGALLNVAPGTSPILPDTPGADSMLWKIPYNTGFSTVGSDSSGGLMQVQWTSVYPELVWLGAYIQYIRQISTYWSIMTGKNAVRFQARLFLDGVMLPGSGPYAFPITGVYRGTGFAARALPTTLSAIQMVPPGAHTFEVKAALAPYNESYEDGGGTSSPVAYVTGPSDGVCIGNRNLWAIRLPFGADLWL